MRRSSWKEMVYGSGTRRTDQHHHRVSRFRMNWVSGLFILGCMYVFFAGWLLLLRGYAGLGVYGSGSPISCMGWAGLLLAVFG